MFAGKPIIGVAGGIGSGKSFVADLFEKEGCLVIRSDDLAKSAYADPTVRTQVEQLLGRDTYDAAGKVRPRAIAGRIFRDPAAKAALERVLHPWVDRRRQQLMTDAGGSEIKAYVWDTPLLFESRLHERCDAVVFVDARRDVRLSRVRASRGWDEAELARRENLQWPLDKKRAFAEYAVENTADAGRS
ncbi:MAG TPA: dephospho-CoA kinase, partial [Tepidisphaeraceae bacterium]|nr:dephospho-CoA kinase [Tepidisphaeraceae bacterium]